MTVMVRVTYSSSFDANSGFISFISTNPNLLQEVVDGQQSLLDSLNRINEGYITPLFHTSV